jgi:hypothetical protein
MHAADSFDATHCSSCIYLTQNCKQQQQQCLICPIGHYCPPATATPLQCPTATPGTSPGLKTPNCSGVPPCNAGDGRDCFTKSRCAAGYYCPAGSHANSQVCASLLLNMCLGMCYVQLDTHARAITQICMSIEQAHLGPTCNVSA